MLFVAADHGGFKLKTELISFLNKKNIEVGDMGAYDFTDGDDYPDYVYPLTQKVLEDPKHNKGIVICRNGQGVNMLANKVRGIRSCVCWNPAVAEKSRTDDNTNILALPSDYITLPTAQKTVLKWLTTDFSNAPRHLRRLAKVAHFERKNNQY